MGASRKPALTPALSPRSGRNAPSGLAKPCVEWFRGSMREWIGEISPRPSPYFAIAKRGEGETLPASSGVTALAARGRRQGQCQDAPGWIIPIRCSSANGWRVTAQPKPRFAGATPRSLRWICTRWDLPEASLPAQAVRPATGRHGSNFASKVIGIGCIPPGRRGRQASATVNNFSHFSLVPL